MIIQKIKKQITVSPKTGNPYAKVLLQFEEYKDGKGNMRWISGFGNKKTWFWKEGDDVAPEITEHGQYLNFSFEDTDENRLSVYQMPATIGFVMDLFKNMKIKVQKPADGVDDTKPQDDAGGSQVDEEEIKPEDIPF